MTLILILIWPYIFCYFADSTTECISNMQRSVYNLNWYNFPPQLQKHFILIMAQSQRPLCFTGFGFVRCKLISFGIVTIKNELCLFNLLCFVWYLIVFRISLSYFSASQIISLLLSSFRCDIKPCMNLLQMLRIRLSTCVNLVSSVNIFIYSNFGFDLICKMYWNFVIKIVSWIRRRWQNLLKFSILEKSLEENFNHFNVVF